MSRENEVLDRLRVIIDPDLGKDIVTLGFIKDLSISDAGDVSFIVELTTPACPVKEQFKTDCNAEVKKLDWVKSVDVTLTAQKARPLLTKDKPGLQNVKHIIAVASCKGGVGKSTSAVNLAYSLSRQGAKVGIFDADIYGPSLPTMVSPDFKGLSPEGALLAPIMYESVKLMSFGYASASSGGGPAILRGPMVTQIINQLVGETAWGELDYLILDLPPGTGDIQLTISQSISVTAAVMVTTPQKLSFIDVEKGIKMFNTMKIPTIAVIENMSYFKCDGCNKEHRLFGTGAMKQLSEQFGIKHGFEIPLVQDIARLSDSGRPIVLEQPDSEVSKRYSEIAEAVVREVSKITFEGTIAPEVTYEPEKGVLFNDGKGSTVVINPAELRRNCRCAHCIEEMTGIQTLKPEDVSDNIQPTGIHKMGNYAVSVQWSDQHSSIYSYDLLKTISTSLFQF